MAKNTSKKHSIKNNLIAVIVILISIAIGFTGGVYFQRHNSGQQLTKSSKSNLSTVGPIICGCPNIIVGEPTVTGPAPCHCPESK